MRHQSGYIWRENGAWYGRWRENVLIEGQVVRKQRSKKLAEVSDRYRTESDVRPLLDEVLGPLNNGKVDANTTMLLAPFVDNLYLPYVKENLKPSTYDGYQKLWQRLKPIVPPKVLRDFRTVDIANVLTMLHKKGLGRNSLHHAKSFLSGIFAYAKNIGALDGLNPARDAIVPKKAKAPKDTHAATPDEVLRVLALFDERKLSDDPDERLNALKVRAAVGLMYFGGLRPGEARGVQWQDYDEKQLTVRQSVWRTHTTEPKTESSEKPIPVIEPLRVILAELRNAEGNPKTGPILRGPSGKALNLDNLARRVVKPELTKAITEQRLPKGFTFDWYSLRRGIGTLTHTIAKDPLAATGLLRHANVSTTQRHYIKTVPEVTQKAMAGVEQLFAERASVQ